MENDALIRENMRLHEEIEILHEVIAQRDALLCELRPELARVLEDWPVERVY